MNKLSRLKKGDTIAILNPSFCGKNVSSDADRITQELQTRGYKVKLMPSFFDKDGYFAGPDEVRTKDINDAFKDKEVKAIICMRGGSGATRIVDKIDYDIIKNNPKIFSGYSDITVLLNAITSRASFVTIHGLCGISLFNSDRKSIDAFFDFLETPSKNRVLKNNKNISHTLVSGVCEGELVGGNLTLITALLGTDYKIDFTDKIVFIEDVTESPYRIERYFSSLRLSGELSKAKGFVFGYFTKCEGEEGKQSVFDVIKEYIVPLGKPVLYGFECGHEFPFVTLPIGAKVRLDADDKTLTILEEIYNED